MLAGLFAVLYSHKQTLKQVGTSLSQMNLNCIENYVIFNCTRILHSSKNSLIKLLRVIINSLRNMPWVKMEYSREQIGTVKKQILVYLPDACCFQIAKGLLFTKKNYRRGSGSVYVKSKLNIFSFS